MAYSLKYSYNSSSQSYSVTGYSDITTSDKVVIPDKYNDGTHGEHSVTSIGNSAFYNCSSLTSITIPNSITNIGNSAFAGCGSLTSVNIPDGVTSIGNSAFAGCGSLTSVNIPDGVTSIGNSAFANCSSLTSVYITDIAAWCKISFSNTYSNPLYYAHNLYLNNELVAELTIPDSVTSIGSVAFAYCSSLTSVTIPDSVTSIGSYAFSNCSSLTSVTIPNSVTSIGTRVFSGCSSLTSVTIPDSVTSIGNYAFSGCSSLTSVTIPDSVTSIGSYAFSNCSSLKQLILFPSTPPNLGSNAIPSTISKIYVPKSSKAAYQTATNWTAFASKIVWDNIYTSFARFNQKNKEYIDQSVDNKISMSVTVW